MSIFDYLLPALEKELMALEPEIAALFVKILKAVGEEVLAFAESKLPFNKLENKPQ